MNRRHGLLAFLCTALAVAAALLQIQVVSGMNELGQLFAGGPADETDALAIALTPPTAAQIPTGPGGRKSLTLFDLQREHRADATLRALSAKHHIPFAVLKAHLALSSKGVLDGQGQFWANTPGVDDAAAGDGLARSEAAAERLGQLKRRLGSVAAALVAWSAGPERTGRLRVTASDPVNSIADSLRTRMIATRRDEALAWLCAVSGLADALEARWPVQDRDLSMRQGPGVRLAATAGETVRAAMDGHAGYVGRDGSRGLCVELIHSCDLVTETCGLAKASIRRGRAVKAGQAIGAAGRSRPLFKLWLGGRPEDASLLLPIEDETLPAAARDLPTDSAPPPQPAPEEDP